MSRRRKNKRNDTSLNADANIMSMMANAATNAQRERMSAAISGGYDYADTLHNIFLDYGYPAALQFSNFWNMYRRFGVARRAVDLFPEQTWKEVPEVEAQQSLLGDIEQLINKGLWSRLEAVDKRQRVGRYGGLFMRVRDNKKPSEPLDGTLAGINSLVDMLPLYESQLKVMETDTEPTSESYGQPIMYQFKGAADGSRSDDTPSTFSIHHTRVIPFAEGADDGSIYGTPALECIYNSLMDLRKILGAGGEGFYRNASQSVMFDLKDPKASSAFTTELSKFNDNFDDFTQNRMRRGMWTPGLEATALESNLISSKDFVDSTIKDIAAGSGYPSSVLIGNQTGTMAGDQDTKIFLSQVQSRRTNWASRMTRSVIDWCMLWGVLQTAEYELEWPDAMAPSTEQRLDNATKMGAVNQTQFMSGGAVPFTGDEIRESAGFEVSEEPLEVLKEPEDD